MEIIRTILLKTSGVKGLTPNMSGGWSTATSRN
jgi:hypothetical protein